MFCFGFVSVGLHRKCVMFCNVDVKSTRKELTHSQNLFMVLEKEQRLYIYKKIYKQTNKKLNALKIMKLNIANMINPLTLCFV